MLDYRHTGYLGEIGCEAHDVDSGVEIVGQVAEDEGAGVDKAENEK